MEASAASADRPNADRDADGNPRGRVEVSAERLLRSGREPPLQHVVRFGRQRSLAARGSNSPPSLRAEPGVSFDAAEEQGLAETLPPTGRMAQPRCDDDRKIYGEPVSEHSDRSTSWEQFRAWPLLVQVLIWVVASWAVILIWLVHTVRHRPLAMKVTIFGLALGLWVAGFVTYVNGSGSAHEVMFPAVDDPVLAQQIDGACPEEPVVSETGLEFVVEAENEALGRFVDELERMDSQRVAQDRPVADWVDDWKSLLRARVAFHERLDSDLDVPLPAVPSVDGYSIAVRMSEIGGVNCEPAPWILDDFDMSGVRTTRGEAS